MPVSIRAQAGAKNGTQKNGRGCSGSSAFGRRYRNQTRVERRAERWTRLIEAAVESFAGRGLRNASIEQLCADANISTRNFYEEFASKEHLLVELHDIVNHRTLGAVAEASRASTTTTSKRSPPPA